MNGQARGTRTAVEDAFRAASGRALATVARILGDVSLAEEAVQEAFVAALRVWPERGIPTNPDAWITTTARNRAIDRLRREGQRAAREQAGAGATSQGSWLPQTPEEAVDAHPVADDHLALLFACCHPALAPDAHVALTLRLVCGLRTTEIARAFLQPEPTVAQRLSRAKRKIRDAGITVRIPPEQHMGERLPSVLACIYLVFTEGYAATDGDALVRPDLCAEAARLTTLLVRLLPEEPETLGLLALIGFHDARRAARFQAGTLVLLADQDRTLWDRRRIDEATAHLDQALTHQRPGPYQLQAAIAGLHANAPTWQDTDWPQIAALYDHLIRIDPSPVVQLNRAVAVAHLAGPRAGLTILDAAAADPRLARTHLLAATRADLLRRADRPVEAAADYHHALSQVRTAPERRFLQRQLADLTAEAPAGSLELQDQPS